MINKLLFERNLPNLKSREEMLEILQREEYGYMPKNPEKTEFEKILMGGDHFSMGGKSETYRLNVKTINRRTFE